MFDDIERGEYLRKLRCLNSELDIAKKEGALYLKEIASLKGQLAASSIDKAKSPSESRIVELKSNPTAMYQGIRTETLVALKLETAALLAQLAGKGETSVPLQSLRNAVTEHQRLEQVVIEKDKRMQRLKEVISTRFALLRLTEQVFAAKSSEFREAVYSLLGYRMDFLPNGRVRLSSMYAEKTDHAFLFDGEAGTMQLTGQQGGDDFMEAVGSLIKFWSEERHSIPGLLSAVTLELFEQGTTGRNSGWM